jgi:GTP pyrophosphokinase
MMYDFSRPSKATGAEPTPVLSARFGDALCMAVGLHRRQRRKGGPIPYAAHLLAVASIVLEYGGTEDEAIAALLHDAVEDQSLGRPQELKEEIERRFGQAVLDIVVGCTDTEEYEYSDEPEKDKKDSWEQRKRQYIEHLADASESVLLVSLADKTHNARSIVRDHKAIGDKLWSRFNRGKEKILWYYEGLVEAFRRRGNVMLFEEFEATVKELAERCRQA